MPKDERELEMALQQPDFVSMKSVVSKMLYVLSIAYLQRGKDFEKLLTLRRGNLKLFAKSSIAIEKTGVHSRPHNIPNSPFWTPTKTSTETKQETVQLALRTLGYSEEIIHSVTAKLIKPQ